jgi:SSS family solute:Na+ symporter
MVAEHFELGRDAIAGFGALIKHADDHFHMILHKPGPDASPEYISKYLLLPASMYFAGLWIANLNYWGCNQYITQRALGANLKTARTGILFAGFLKLLMPVIVMLPGIAAYVIHQNGGLQAEMVNAEGKVMADNAYSAILTFLPNGLKGLSMAALTAAIVASLAGKANSISTIFTLDIYKRFISPSSTEKQLVWVGRLAIFAAMLIAIGLTWNDTLNIGGAGGFQFIQKYTGYISPGVFAIFILGMFWKRTTGAAAVVGVLSGFLLSVFFNEFAPTYWGAETFLYTAYPTGTGSFEIPFLNCMGLAFLITVALMMVISLAGPPENPKAFQVDASMFRVSPAIMFLIVTILVILSAIYVKFW